MNSVQTHARIVAHCLAVWSAHTGALTQQEKDFFDACVENVPADADEFQCVLESIEKRLQTDGLPSEESFDRARQMVAPYAEGWGVRLQIAQH